MSPTVKGFLNASISGITFGLIPLFAIPVLNTGMHSTSVLIYRYAFGCLAMLCMLMFHRTRMRLAFGDFLRILLLSSMYAVSSITLIEGYNYMASGIATTLLFSYPVWTCLLSVVFLHEKLSATTAIAIAIAVGGVFFLSGILDGQGDMQGLTGLFLLLTSGFLYAVYMVAFPRMRIRKIPSLKLTFYIFFFAMLILTLYATFTRGRFDPIDTHNQLINLFLLGLVPTAISNVTLIISLKQISSTMAAVLGAFEPMTAMCVGILLFGEPLTLPIVIGFVLIITSVLILVLSKRKTGSPKHHQHPIT
ncbi:DMT family transporter [Hoylesella shahii]